MQEVIQLRLTRAALDRLIGDDKEMELILTHAAVKQVVTDHLDAVTTAAKNAVTEVVDAAYGSIQRVWDDGNKYTNKFVLSGEFAKAINDQIRSIIDTEVHNQLVRDRSELMRIVESVIDKKASMMIESETTNAMKKLIERAAKAVTGN